MSICLGRIIESSMNYNSISPSLRLEIELIDDWGMCSMEFNEVNSFKILNEIGEVDTMIDNSYKMLKGLQVIMLKHPKGGTLAPIAIKKEKKSEWIYKENIYEY